MGSSDVNTEHTPPPVPLEGVPLVSPVIRGILWVLDPADNPASVVYGFITVGAVIAAESGAGIPLQRSILATLVVLILYWCAHAYSSLLGARLQDGKAISLRSLSHALRKEWALMRGASLPIVAMILVWIFHGSAPAAEWAGILTVVALLILLEVAAGLRSKLSGWGIFLQGCVGIAFGAGLVAIRALLA